MLWRRIPAASLQVAAYDRDHKDYHNWDENEDRAWRGYLNDQHHTYRGYGKANKKEQSDYWKWRHDHPDAH